MEVFNAPILEKIQFFSGISVFRPYPFFTKRCKTNPFRDNNSHSNFLLKFPYSSSSTFSNGRRLHISAHFRQPRKRRNSLRKKLSEKQQQVRPNPDTFEPGSYFQNPNYISDEIESLQSNLDYGNSKESSFGVSEGEMIEPSTEEKPKLQGDSILWTKLENWVDQYKQDSEFWGIGSGPVFTIFQDLNGNVERVSVHEDEISSRSQLQVPSFRQEEQVVELKEVNSKISHAKSLARAIETGKYKLPKNTSIAKFVVSGKQTGFVNGLRSFTLQPNLIPKLSVIGSVMLCGSFLFWAMRRLLTVRNDEVELTREEKEMLRRKIKSRIGKEKMEKGSVEVLPGALEPLMGHIERPQLNTKELLDNILKAKASEDKLTLLDSSGTLTMESGGFNDKIQEIREMARHARELERQVPSLHNRDGEENEAVNESSNDMKSGMMHEELGVDFLNNLLNGAEKPMGIDETIKPASIVDPKTEDTGFFSEVISVDAAENCDLQIPNRTLSMEISEDVQNSIQDPKESKSSLHLSNTGEESLSRDNPHGKPYSSSKNFVAIKPRVIWSVKEAREYLSQKHDKGEADKEAQLRSLQERADTFNPAIDQEPNRKTNETNYKEKLSGVEVLPDALEPLIGNVKKPQLDKEEFLDSILKANVSEDKLTLLDSSSSLTAKSGGFNDEIQEIRKMAWHTQKLEQQFPSLPNSDEEENEVNGKEKKALNEPSIEMKNGKMHEDSGNFMCIDGTTKPASVDDPKTEGTGLLSEVFSADTAENSDFQTPARTLSIEISEDEQNTVQDPKESEISLYSSNMRGECLTSSITYDKSYSLDESSVKTKPMVIRSVKEAREYLSQKRGKEEVNQGGKFRSQQEEADFLNSTIDREPNEQASEAIYNENEVLEPSLLGETSDPKKKGLNGDVPKFSTIKNEDPKDAEEKYGVGSHQGIRTSRDYTGIDSSTEAGPVTKESWVEKNFQQFEPIIEKIRDGFRDNYMVAREKVQEELNLNPEKKQLESSDDDSELGWMKDDGLREIVFQVRENELAGRDPFHLLDTEDKRAFFEGLERKVEKENTKLSSLHEWIHSRVENLDYGADGISLYDPPEKIIPRWKGQPVDKDPEFINNFVEQRKAFVAGNMAMSQLINKDAQDALQRSEKSAFHDNISTSSAVHDPKKMSRDEAVTSSKILIESSDGSTRAGKKSGKEYWQHTKKWSREFLESYNAETDPEVKSIMKDMGKDLDRWITDKEIKEAADLMTRIPKRRRRYIEKKLDKLKREMETFGPQAVVSKYREYAEEEEDYLWWLDIPYVLCIELYTNEDGVQKVGFYSLEMAADLELDPKQYHVIAFEDPGDSKNFCYIMQAHMEMLGNGHAFVVARPPKDAFREAKANGFSVTVIRKGKLQLNVDQTLEEVEEQITEIGSKMYHDKIMRERSVDMGSIMKGVFGTRKPSKRRLKRMLKKPAKL